MPTWFRPVMTAAAFASGIVAPAAYAQSVPNPAAGIAGIGIGTVSLRPDTGSSTVAVNVGETQRQRGELATVSALGPFALTDVAISESSTGRRTQVADVIGIGVGSLNVTNPNDGNSAITLSVAQANPPQGSDASIGVASGGSPLSVGLPGWTGLPGLSRLPFTLPKIGGR
ncbi:hypothetical protein M9980_00580 [Sphingomonas donggukensis]|uniref:Uncharacterized protein n=1 Tax=Sphingomonas donggukensis TaxID=2949093 RepID=A0ABY4TX92_9SPHN|nr:hypothetical protein [Sphingomonas donggukensis]URW75769.1 hypothetical protein M9980_00580 [Sphingomonas donggukensis]